MKPIFALLLFSFLSVSAQDVFNLARSGHLPELQKLYSENPQVIQQTNNRGATALHFACDGGHTNIIEFLLASGADLSARDIDGDTPLHWAAFAGRNEAVQLLINNQAELNSRNKNKLTPLAYAVTRNHPGTVDIFLAAGADPVADGENGSRILHSAAQNGMGPLVTQLIKNGTQFDTPRNDKGNLLHSLALGGLVQLTQTMIKKGLDVDLQNRYGWTPLLLAARCGQLQIVKLLAENGADLTRRGFDGKNALQIASENEHSSTIEYLENRMDPARMESAGLPAGRYFGLEAPGLQPQLFAPGIISTGEANERDMTWSSDFSRLFFTRNAAIHLTEFENGTWSYPQTAEFSGTFRDYEACFTPDDQQIYFISRRPVSENDSAPKYEIWYVNQQHGKWSSPVLLGSPFEGCFYPTFTQDWKLYYTGADQNLHYAQYKDGIFEAPVELSRAVNTDKGEYNSFIARDESYLIFTSHGFDDSFGAGDLYISFRNADGSWSAAQNMGESINSEAEDYCPSVTPDGKFFFFSSRRFGNEDIFWVSTEIFQQLKN